MILAVGPGLARRCVPQGALCFVWFVLGVSKVVWLAFGVSKVRCVEFGMDCFSRIAANGFAKIKEPIGSVKSYKPLLIYSRTKNKCLKMLQTINALTIHSSHHVGAIVLM